MSFQISDVLIDSSMNDSLLDVSAATINPHISSDIVPSINNIYNLGSPAAPFNTIYLSSNSLIIGTIALSSVDNSLNIGTPEQNVSIQIPSGSLAIKDATIAVDPLGNLALPASTTIGNVLPGTINILNIFNSTSSLPSDAILGDAYMIAPNSSVAGELYVCTNTTQTSPSNFTNIGPIQGIQGVQGPPGVQGPQSTPGGLFTLLPTPGLSPNAAQLPSPNSILSGITGQGALWNGRIQSLNSYNNTPFSVSFNLPGGVGSQTYANAYCIIGVSSTPAANINSNTYSGIFDAAFIIYQTTVQFVVNKNGTPTNASILSPPGWTQNSIFILNFDGYSFNFLINEPSYGTNNIPKQVFSYPVTTQLNYYFVASFASGTGSGGYSQAINVSNIIFSPYAPLNPTNYFGNTINNYIWGLNGTNPYPTMNINNSYIFSLSGQSIISSNRYGSIYNNGTFSIPLEGFIFSCVLPETYSNIITIVINGGPGGTQNNYDQEVRIAISASTTYSFVIVTPSNKRGTSRSFNVGDILQVYYNPSNALSNLYIYVNQFIVWSVNNFGPVIPCNVSITSYTSRSGNIPYQPITLVNPLFYQYGNLALHL
jgi:hypothetical protein